MNRDEQQPGSRQIRSRLLLAVGTCTFALTVAVLTAAPASAAPAPQEKALSDKSPSNAGAVSYPKNGQLPDDALDRQMGVVDGWPHDMVASMLHDLNSGKRMELDYFSGAVCRLGRANGVATPVHDILYAALKPYKDGNIG